VTRLQQLATVLPAAAWDLCVNQLEVGVLCIFTHVTSCKSALGVKYKSEQIFLLRAVDQRKWKPLSL